MAREQREEQTEDCQHWSAGKRAKNPGEKRKAGQRGEVELANTGVPLDKVLNWVRKRQEALCNGLASLQQLVLHDDRGAGGLAVWRNTGQIAKRIG